MLNQIDIYTYKTDTSKLWSGLSVKIHGYIMSKIDTDYAAELHAGGVMPFSNFTVETADFYITRISTWDDKAELITELFHKGDTIRIFGTDTNLKVAEVRRTPEISLEKLVSMVTGRTYKLTLLTPAMYKSNGETWNLPIFPQYFESVRTKLEKFFGIIITKEMLNAAFSEMKVLEYETKSSAFISGSRQIPGMTGYFKVKLPNSGENSKILRTLLAFATYSGLGGQTTQGMGGFILERQNN